MTSNSNKIFKILQKLEESLNEFERHKEISSITKDVKEIIEDVSNIK